jgi:hypothetical protein
MVTNKHGDSTFGIRLFEVAGCIAPVGLVLKGNVRSEFMRHVMINDD